MLKRATAVALVLLVPIAGGACASAQAPKVAAANHGKKPKPKPKLAQVPVTLNGAGANSIDPFFSSVFYYYHETYPKITVNYDPAGSSVGISDIQQGTVNFGDSEIPMQPKDLALAKGPVLQVPGDLGGVAISYNIPDVASGLKLDGPTLASIFDGTIENWDSPVIAAESGDNSLPNLPIVVVHRADSAGPTWDVDDYLIQTAPSWVQVIGTKNPSKTWPITGYGLGEQLNSGVATYIAQTKGAIGYVEYGYSVKAGFTNAAILNSSGAYVVPSSPSIGAAGSYAQDLSPSNFSIINEPGAITYPIANFSWTLLSQKQSNTAVGEALQALFKYVVTTGQALAAGLGYAPLPVNVVAIAQATLKQLETSTGKPLPS